MGIFDKVKAAKDMTMAAADAGVKVVKEKNKERLEAKAAEEEVLKQQWQGGTDKSVDQLTPQPDQARPEQVNQQQPSEPPSQDQLKQEIRDELKKQLRQELMQEQQIKEQLKAELRQELMQEQQQPQHTSPPPQSTPQEQPPQSTPQEQPPQSTPQEQPPQSTPQEQPPQSTPQEQPPQQIHRIDKCGVCNKNTLTCSTKKTEHVLCINPICESNKKHKIRGMSYGQSHFANWKCTQCGGKLTRVYDHSQFNYVSKEWTTVTDSTWGYGRQGNSTTTRKVQVDVIRNKDIRVGGWSELVCADCESRHEIVTWNMRLLACPHCNFCVNLKNKKKHPDVYTCSADPDMCKTIKKGTIRTKYEPIPLTNILCWRCKKNTLVSIMNGEYAECSGCKFVHLSDPILAPGSDP